MTLRLLVFASLLLGACSLSREPSPPEVVAPVRPGGWRTVGNRILDAENRERLLHGFNVSNDSKRPPYLGWAQEADYARLQSWGVSVVRLLVSWAAVMPAPGVIDEVYLAAHDQRVAWAARHGLAVIIDLHQDVFGVGFHDNGAPRWACDEALYAAHVPRQPWYLNYLSPPVQECFRRLWTEAALQDRFAEAALAFATRHWRSPNVIGFDLFNEPFWGSDNPSMDDFHRLQLQPFYERVMGRIEAAAPGYLFFVEPATVSQWGIEPAFVPFARGNVVYAPHFYHVQTHDNHAYDGDATPITRVMDQYQATALRLGVPLWLGEWGGHVDSVRFDDFLRDVLGALQGHGAGFAYYDFSLNDGDFTPLRADGSEKPGFLDVFARVHPKATAGHLVSYAFDDRSRVFTMTYESRPDAVGSTVLALPARQYPDGFTVESSDPSGRWSFEQDVAASELRLRHDPAAASHVVTVRPAR